MMFLVFISFKKIDLCVRAPHACICVCVCVCVRACVRACVRVCVTYNFVHFVC